MTETAATLAARIAEKRVAALDSDAAYYERRDLLRDEQERRGLSAVQERELHLIEEALMQLEEGRDREQEAEIHAENAWLRAAEYDEENQAQLDRDAQYGDPIPADLEAQWAAYHAAHGEQQ